MVRYGLNSALHYPIDFSKRQKVDVYFKKSTVSIQNNPFHLFGQSLEEFGIFEYSNAFDRAEVIPEEMPLEDREYVSFYLRADPLVNYYSRKGQSMFQFIAVVVALREFMRFVMYIFIGWIIENQFKAEVIGESYMYEKKPVKPPE